MVKNLQYILFFAIIGISSNSVAQIFYSNGAIIQVNTGAVVHINGNALLDNATAIVNDGEIRTRINSVGGSYEINNATVNSGNGKYKIENDWINNATFIANNSEVILDGTNQFIRGTNVTTFHDLTLQTGGIKTQQIDAQINATGTLNLNSFELATDNFKMEVLNTNPNAITKTPGSLGFVSSLGTGKLYRVTNLTTNYLFPTGSSLNPPRYRPVEIVPVSIANSMYGARLANNIATIDGYDIVNNLDTTLCSANDKFYHRINKVVGSESASYSVYYDQLVDGMWNGTAQWQIPTVNLWNATGVARDTTAYTLQGLTRSSWNFVDNSVTTGDQYVLAKVRPPSPLVNGPAGTCGVSTNVQTIAVGSNSTAVIHWTFPSGVTFVTQGNDTVISDWTNGVLDTIYVSEDFQGCLSYPTIYNLNIYPAPIAIIDTVVFGVVKNLYAFKDSSIGVNINAWQWTFGDNDSSTLQHPVHMYNTAGNLTVMLKVTNSYGCSDTATLLLSQLKEKIVYANIFTPNGDGVNDVFFFPNVGLEDDYNLKIYDRWGILIFATQGKNISWDGKSVSGNKVPSGTYYYTLDAKSKTKDYSKNGSFSLMGD